MYHGNFKTRAAWEAWHKWNMERITSGELRETLRKRHVKIEVDPKTIKLLEQIRKTREQK